MRYAFAVLTAVAALALAACESNGGYDGVSRFAGSSGVDTSYYGPGSPPRDFGGVAPHS